MKCPALQSWRAAARVHSAVLEQLMGPAVHPGASGAQADKPHRFPHSSAGGLMKSALAFL